MIVTLTASGPALRPLGQLPGDRRATSARSLPTPPRRRRRSPPYFNRSLPRRLAPVETGLAGKRVLGDGRVGRDRRCLCARVCGRGRLGVRPLPPRPRAGRGGRGRAGRGADRRRRPDARGRDRSAVREALGRSGGLDVCAAVAGVWPREDVPVWELSLERWEQHAGREPARDVPHGARLPARGGALGSRQPGDGRVDGRAWSARRAMRTTRPRSRRSRTGCCSA